MSTLLARAKAIKAKPQGEAVSDEMVDLALAWLRSEVKLTQVSKVLFPDSKQAVNGGAVYALCRALRTAYEQGRLKEGGAK